MSRRTRNLISYAVTTIKSIKSREKYIKRLFGLYPEATEDNVRTFLMPLNLSNIYKLAILTQLSKAYPHLQNADFRKYLHKNKKRSNMKRDPNFIPNLNKIIMHVLQTINDMKSAKLNDGQTCTRANLEMYVAVAIAVATGMRSHEIICLSIYDLKNLKDGNLLTVKLKKREERTIVTTLDFYKDMLDFLIFTLAEAYDTTDEMSDNLPCRFANDQEKRDFVESPFTSKLRSQDAFTCCVSSINKAFRALYITICHEVPKNRLGLQSIRRYTTTLLLNLGRDEIARLFNRHAQSSSTQHYNLTDPSIALQAVSIGKLADERAHLSPSKKRPSSESPQPNKRKRPSIESPQPNKQPNKRRSIESIEAPQQNKRRSIESIESMIDYDYRRRPSSMIAPNKASLAQELMDYGPNEE